MKIFDLTSFVEETAGLLCENMQMAVARLQEGPPSNIGLSTRPEYKRAISMNFHHYILDNSKISLNSPKEKEMPVSYHL